MISRPRAGMRRVPRAAVIAGLALLSGAVLAAPASAGVSTSAADENWLVAAHQANLAEIAAGRDARRYATDDDVRDFADELVEEHTQLDEQIVDLAEKYDVFLPKAPTAAQSQALAALQGREGEAYDAAWVRARIAAHRQARALADRERTAGEAGDVKAAARDVRVTEERHLEALGELGVDLGIARPPAEVSGGTGGQAAAAFDTSRALPAGIIAAVGIALLGAEVVLARRRRKAGR